MIDFECADDLLNCGFEDNFDGCNPWNYFVGKGETVNKLMFECNMFLILMLDIYFIKSHILTSLLEQKSMSIQKWTHFDVTNS